MKSVGFRYNNHQVYSTFKFFPCLAICFQFPGPEICVVVFVLRAMRTVGS